MAALTKNLIRLHITLGFLAATRHSLRLLRVLCVFYTQIRSSKMMPGGI